ncbi:hypothetical protein Csp2054_17325 [Curtobacterium sp. 'Ferrero']|uniref:hypothetical protein n=1 Tax=Curtobacterium sp. 'Ferrero' TaxID=2033654 RepID=UPI000BD0DA14|nr:hypothetical protein [Curtobacterium sp. 'Ferrero']PCN46424.1 hypothetical protein Csp2054_17325 [Curtobacterium sp. 'Ferrero']
MKTTQPDHWRYEIDPGFDPAGEVPPFAILGAWPMNARDEIVGDFVVNPDYAASPVARMLDIDADPFTMAWSEHARFALDDAGFRDAITRTTWFGLESDGQLVVFDQGTGPRVRAWSSRKHLEAAGDPSAAPLDGSALFGLAKQGIALELNAAEQTACVLSAEFLNDIADA